MVLKGINVKEMRCFGQQAFQRGMGGASHARGLMAGNISDQITV